jgi:hypothetical protein
MVVQLNNKGTSVCRSSKNKSSAHPNKHSCMGNHGKTNLHVLKSCLISMLLMSLLFGLQTITLVFIQGIFIPYNIGFQFDPDHVFDVKRNHFGFAAIFNLVLDVVFLGGIWKRRMTALSVRDLGMQRNGN